jgi:hypothetical protein
MKYVPISLLFVFLSMLAKAQEPRSPGARFRYMNVWSSVSASTLSTHRQTTVDIDSASDLITIRVTDPQFSETLKIYDLNGNVLFKRPLVCGNNVLTLTGISRQIFVFCVEHNGLSHYSMKVARI